MLTNYKCYGYRVYGDKRIMDYKEVSEYFNVDPESEYAVCIKAFQFPYAGFKEGETAVIQSVDTGYLIRKNLYSIKRK